MLALYQQTCSSSDTQTRLVVARLLELQCLLPGRFCREHTRIWSVELLLTHSADFCCQDLSSPRKRAARPAPWRSHSRETPGGRTPGRRQGGMHYVRSSAPPRCRTRPRLPTAGRKRYEWPCHIDGWTCEPSGLQNVVEIHVGNWMFKELIGSIAKILLFVNSFCQFICIYIAIYLLNHVYLVL